MGIDASFFKTGFVTVYVKDPKKMNTKNLITM